MSMISRFASTISSTLLGNKVKDDNLQDKNDPIEDRDSPGLERKRSRESEADDRRPTKKAQRRSKDEKRLLEHTSKPPKDATPLTFPQTYNPQTDWSPLPQKQSQGKMAQGSRKKGVHPINTLNKPTPQSGKSKEGFNFKQFQNPEQRPPQQRKIEQDQGNSAIWGDEVERGERPHKKQKTQKSGGHVDLTRGEEPDIGVAIGRPNGKFKSRSGSGGASQHFQPEPRMKQANLRNDISTSQEQHDVDVLLGARKSHPQQWLNDNEHISQSSRAETQSLKQPKAKARHDVPPQEVIDLDVDERSQLNVQSNTSSRRQMQSTANGGRPTIDLEQGWPNYDKQSTKVPGQGQRTVNQGSRSMMDGFEKISEKGAPQVQLKRPHPNGSAPSQRSNASNSYSGRSSEHARDLTQDSESRLATTFKRDNGPAQKPSQAKRKDKMQTSSRPSLTSEDELCGDKTVGTGSRNASPQKRPIRSCAPDDEVFEARDVGKSLEPSIIKPTNYTRGGKPLSDAMSQVNHDVVSREEADNTDEMRVPIRALYCKAYVARQAGLQLIWDDALSAFVLLQGNLRVRSPNIGNELVRVGPREVSKWNQQKDEPLVWIQGPMSELSSGVILIEFEDAADAWLCYDSLFSLDHSVKHVLTPVDRIMEVFKKKESELAQAHAKSKADADRSRRSMLGRAMETFPKPSEMERIVYENEPEPARTKAINRMRGNRTLAEAIDDAKRHDERQTRGRDETVSNYFEPRRSTRQQSAAVVYKEQTPPPVKWTEVNKPKEWANSVVYPDQGPRRVTVDFHDLERLDEGEFLNDNLVSFELRWIEENMAPQHREKVHFFNTYFFTSLSQKNGRKDFNYDAVKRWTKKTDLFTVPYAVVPINLDSHWFVAIICNLPAIVRESDESTNDRHEPHINEQTIEVAESVSEAHDDVASSAQDVESPKSGIFKIDDDGIVQDSALGPSAAFPNLSRGDAAYIKRAKAKALKKKAPGLRKYDPKEPIIMSLDSFSLPRSSEMKYLKLYVCAEADTKRGLVLDQKDIPSMSAKGLPEQPNFCDCGVFLVGYIAEFAKDPDEFVRKVLTREMDRNNEFADFDAPARRAEIRDKLLKLNQTQEAARTEQKRAKAAARAAKAQATQTTQTQTVTESAKKPTVQDHIPQKSSPVPAPAELPREATLAQASVTSSSAPSSLANKADPDGDEEELEVEAPSYLQRRGQQSKRMPDTEKMLAALGHTNRVAEDGEQELEQQEDDGEEEDDDEMLLDGTEDRRGEPEASHPPGLQTSRGRDNVQGPVKHFSSQTEANSPLRSIEEWANDMEPVEISGPAKTSQADGAIILDLPEEDGGQRGSVTGPGMQYRRDPLIPS